MVSIHNCIKSNLEKFFKEPEKFVKKHSDRNKLFYRLIDSLNRFGLITKRYFESQIKPISDMDALITQSLDSLRKKDESRREFFEMTPGVLKQKLDGVVRGETQFNRDDYKKPNNIFTPKSLLEHFSKIYSQHHGNFVTPETCFSTARQPLYTEGAKLAFRPQAESSGTLIDDRPLPEACEARSYEISNRVEKFTGSATAAGLFSKILEHPGWNDFFAKMTTVINDAEKQVTFEVASENNGDSVVTQMPAPHNQDSIDHTAEKLNKNPKFSFRVSERTDCYTFRCVADIISPSMMYNDHPDTIQYFELANEGVAEDMQIALTCEFDISREAALKGEIEILRSDFLQEFKWKLD
ncbi:hypothetical protein OA90_27145 [Labrenzia sp. OB1]|nr:hypothetical protein OA90_27145 [Labrenzia sp. OB1]